MDYANSLYLTGPEVFLSVSGLILTLIAAWGGQKAARLSTILAVGALVGASIITAAFLINPAFEQGGDAFGGL